MYTFDPRTVYPRGSMYRATAVLFWCFCTDVYDCEPRLHQASTTSTFSLYQTAWDRLHAPFCGGYLSQQEFCPRRVQVKIQGSAPSLSSRRGKLSASDANLAQESRYFQALVSLLGTHGQWHPGQCSEVQGASYI